MLALSFQVRTLTSLKGDIMLTARKTQIDSSAKLSRNWAISWPQFNGKTAS